VASSIIIEIFSPQFVKMLPSVIDLTATFYEFWETFFSNDFDASNYLYIV